ncbi:MAG: hypothetical protein Q8K75_07320 [Chlamydiales bacterium]|nr:hypothetical protein [Chlamydiales bacterium]
MNGLNGIGLRRAGTFTDYVLDGEVNSDGSYTIQLHDGRYFTLNVQDRTGTSTALDEKKWEQATTLILAMLQKKGIIQGTNAPIGGTNVSAKGVKNGAASAIEHKDSSKGRRQTVKEYQQLSALVNGRQPGTGTGTRKVKKSKKHRRVSSLSTSSSPSRGRSRTRHNNIGSTSDSSPSQGPERRGRRTSITSHSPSPVRDNRLDRALDAMHQQSQANSDLQHRQIQAMQAQFDALQDANARLQAELREANAQKDAIIDGTLKQQANLIDRLSTPEPKPAPGASSPLSVSSDSNVSSLDALDVPVVPPVNPQLDQALNTIQQQSAALQGLFTTTLEQITAANERTNQILSDRFAAQDEIIQSLLPKETADTDTDSESDDDFDAPVLTVSPVLSPRSDSSEVSNRLDTIQEQFSKIQEDNARLQDRLLETNQNTQRILADLVRGNQDNAPKIQDIIQGMGEFFAPQNKALDSNTRVIAALAETLQNAQQPPGNVPGVGGGAPLHEAAVGSIIEDRAVRALHDAIVALKQSNNDGEVLDAIRRLEDKVNTPVPSQVVEMIRNEVDQLRQGYREQMQSNELTQRHFATEQAKLNEHIAELIKLLGQREGEVKSKAHDIQRIEREISILSEQIADSSEQAKATKALRKSMEENFQRLFELLGNNGGAQNNREAQQQIEALRNEIDGLKERENEAKEDIEALREKLAKKDRELNERGNLSQRQARELQERDEQMGQRIKELEIANAKLFADLSKANGEIARLTLENQQLNQRILELLEQGANDNKRQAEALEQIGNRFKADSELKDDIIENVRGELGELEKQNAELLAKVEELEAALGQKDAEIDELVQRLQEAEAHRGITPAEVDRMKRELIEMYSGSDRIARACCKGQVRRRVFGKGMPKLQIGYTSHPITPAIEEAMWTAFGIGQQYLNVLREVQEEHKLHRQIQALETKFQVAEGGLKALQKLEASREEATHLLAQIGTLRLDLARGLELPDNYAAKDSEEGKKTWFRDHLIEQQNILRTAFNRVLKAGSDCAKEVSRPDLFDIHELGLIK